MAKLKDPITGRFLRSSTFKKDGRLVRKCYSCKEVKDLLEEFSISRHNPDGRQSFCKICSGRETRKYYLQRKYDISQEVFNEMMKAQGEVCAICSKEMNPPHVDHCHTTGKVRGLLCLSCNTSLGQMKDDIKLLEAAIQYLRERG